MVQVPAVRNAAVVPEIVQTPVVDEAKLTARLELADAESVNGVLTVCAGIGMNVMVCGCGFTVKFCVTGVAAA